MNDNLTFLLIFFDFLLQFEHVHVPSIFSSLKYKFKHS